MGTKANPSKYDCYAKAEADEPIFTLRARDPVAPFVVAIWTAIRAGDIDSVRGLAEKAISKLEGSDKTLMPYDSSKSIEACQCCRNMEIWYDSRILDKVEAEEKCSG